MNSKVNDAKEKLKKLKWIVEDFLEEYEDSRKILIDDPHRIEKLESGLKDNLLHQEKSLEDNVMDSIEIYKYHIILLKFWGAFKVRLSDFRKNIDSDSEPLIGKEDRELDGLPPGRYIIDIPPPARWEINYSDDNQIKSFYPGFEKLTKQDFERLNEPMFLMVSMDLTGEEITFFQKSYIDIVRDFMSLLENTNPRIFLECSNQTCNRWYLKTDARRQYCHNRCASRVNQKKLREDKERYDEHKRKMRERYRRKILGD